MQLFSQQSERNMNVLYDKTYKDMIQEIDAIDNGVEVCDEPR
jgi:uncharacterized UPF0160 family protein